MPIAAVPGRATSSPRKAMAADWKPELRLAVEVIFPTWLLLGCLRDFAVERPETRIELYETVLGGTYEALQSRAVDLAIVCPSRPRTSSATCSCGSASSPARTRTTRCTSSDAS